MQPDDLLQPDDLEDVTLFVAQRFLVIQRGPMFDPATWVDVAARRGHEVKSWHEPGGKVGEYLSSEPGTGTVWYNTAYSPVTQCHAIVHEMAHAEMNLLASGLCHGEQPGFLAGHFCRAGFDDGPEDAGQRIARRVENVIFTRPTPPPRRATEDENPVKAAGAGEPGGRTDGIEGLVTEERAAYDTQTQYGLQTPERIEEMHLKVSVFREHATTIRDQIAAMREQVRLFERQIDSMDKSLTTIIQQ